MNDHSHDVGEERGTVAVVASDRFHLMRGNIRYVPGFLYLLIIYAVIKSLGVDVRHVLFTVGTYPLTVVEMLQLAASVIAMTELLKVSHPGENNTLEVLCMLAGWLVYFVLFILGATGRYGFGIFSNTEFFMLMLIYAFQVFIAFLLNARTLVRSITDTR